MLRRAPKHGDRDTKPAQTPRPDPAGRPAPEPKSVEATSPYVSGPGRPLPDDTGPVAFAWAERLWSDYDLDGPRVRMGMLWFVVAIGAAWLGTVSTAVVFGLVAGAAGFQIAAAWRRARARPNQIVAGVGALVICLAAMPGIGLAALVGLGLIVVALVLAAFDRRRRVPLVVSAGATVRSGFFVGIAGASAVLVGRIDGAALITLIVLVSGYEIGDYLVGTGASNPLEGPIAGIIAVLVLTFAISVFEFAPFETGSARVFGGLVAVLAPLGRFVATILPPWGKARVPALHRLDSYLLVAPVWAWMLWGYLG